MISEHEMMKNFPAYCIYISSSLHHSQGDTFVLMSFLDQTLYFFHILAVCHVS